MFPAVTVNSGLSLAYGSGWCWPGRKFAKPACDAEVMPPSHAGIEPSALPAFSAPSGVSSAPSFAASEADAAAAAGPPINMPASIERQGSSDFLIMVSSRCDQNEYLSVAATKSRSLMSLKRPAPPNLVHDVSISHLARRFAATPSVSP